MYKKGVRWIEYSESEGIGEHDTKHMVLDYIITIFTTIDHPYKYRDHPVTLVILIIIIISQVLGHTNFKEKTQKENNMCHLSMNRVTMKF